MKSNLQRAGHLEVGELGCDRLPARQRTALDLDGWRYGATTLNAPG